MKRGGGPGEGTGDLGPERAGWPSSEDRDLTDGRLHGYLDGHLEGRRPSAGQEPDTGHRPVAGHGRGRHRRGERGALESRSKGGGRVGVTYKYFGAPDGATAARVPVSMRPEELGGDELGRGGLFTKIKPETMAAMVLTGIEGIPLHRVPPLELVVLHPDYAVVKLPMTVVDPLRGIGEESVGAAAFIWSTVPDRGGPQDAFVVYQLLHEWQDFSHRLHDAGHQAYCLVWP